MELLAVMTEVGPRAAHDMMILEKGNKAEALSASNAESQGQGCFKVRYGTGEECWDRPLLNN